MTLVVHAPAGYLAERRYILGVVLGEWLGLDWRLAEHGHPTCASASAGTEQVVRLPDRLFAVDPDRWLTADALPRDPADASPGRPGRLGGAGRGRAASCGLRRSRTAGNAPLVELDETGARIGVDVFGSAFALLTRYEEAIGGERDRYQRYPAAASLAVRAGFLRTPLVDAYVELLWSALVRLWPRLTRRPRRYRVLLSHDVDDPLSTLGRGPALRARQLAGDLVRRRDAGLMARRARALLDARRGRLDSDPHNTFDFLMAVSERHGLRSAFHFLANNDVNPRGGRFDLIDHPWVQRLIGRVHERGHEVGFHAGFGTFRDPAPNRRGVRAAARGRRASRGAAAALGRAAALPAVGQPGHLAQLGRAGLAYDCTLAFSEAPGFRTGTCHEYPVFDLVARRPLHPAGAAVPGHGRDPVRAPAADPGRGARRGDGDRHDLPAIPGHSGHPLAQRRGPAHPSRTTLVRVIDRLRHHGVKSTLAR